MLSSQGFNTTLHLRKVLRNQENPRIRPVDRGIISATFALPVCFHLTDAFHFVPRLRPQARLATQAMVYSTERPIKQQLVDKLPKCLAGIKFGIQ